MLLCPLRSSVGSLGAGPSPATPGGRVGLGVVVHEASVADEGHSLAQYMVALSTTEGLCPVGGDGGEGGGTEGGAGSNSVLDFKIRIDGHKM